MDSSDDVERALLFPSDSSDDVERALQPNSDSEEDLNVSEPIVQGPPAQTLRVPFRPAADGELPPDVEVPTFTYAYHVFHWTEHNLNVYSQLMSTTLSAMENTLDMAEEDRHSRYWDGNRIEPFNASMTPREIAQKAHDLQTRLRMVELVLYGTPRPNWRPPRYFLPTTPMLPSPQVASSSTQQPSNIEDDEEIQPPRTRTRGRGVRRCERHVADVKTPSNTVAGGTGSGANIVAGGTGGSAGTAEGSVGGAGQGGNVTNAGIMAGGTGGAVENPSERALRPRLSLRIPMNPDGTERRRPSYRD